MKLKQSILIVGQTPPPFGGQALMIKNIVDFMDKYENVYHIKMGFASDMDDIGRFRISKLFKLFILIIKIYYIKINKQIDVLYYPGAGNLSKGPLYRDFILLFCTRFLFKKTIFHFHAAGLSSLFPNLNWVERNLVKICFGRPDTSIILSKLNIADAKLIQSQKIDIIPYGIEDFGYKIIRKFETIAINILFVGVVRESKGIWVLLRAINILHQNNIRVTLNIVGKVDSNETELAIKTYLEKNHLEEHIKLLGVKIGDEKWSLYKNADIFCFPSHFECEGLPVVCIEAMMFGLPIVSTKWRGIPDLVQDNENGFLCSIKNEVEIAHKLSILISDVKLREKMGLRSRNIFEIRYSQDKFFLKIKESFENC